MLSLSFFSKIAAKVHIFYRMTKEKDINMHIFKESVHNSTLLCTIMFPSAKFLLHHSVFVMISD